MTQERYNPEAIEEKWQARWLKEKTYACTPDPARKK